MEALYIGGPTVILTLGGLRLMTDPTLDPAGHSYPTGGGKFTLEKAQSPATTAIGKIDVVLLSHDQHPDNLDTAGRALLQTVTHTYTTVSGSRRLGGNSIGLAPWESQTLTTPDGSQITITATPARHGPAGIEPISGDVIGFILSVKGPRTFEIYVTGDTVFYEGVAEVAKKFKPEYIFLFAGAARVRGPFNLTMGTNDAIDTAAAFPTATIIPLHYEGWRHFTQNQADLQTSFGALGIGDRLKILPAGVEVQLFPQ
jgi:L-ascorbate metabolism protein UlaG (beta-lactamase superfamily)